LETAPAGLSVIIRSNLEKSAARQAVKPPNFFVELKRRNVYKVAIAYAVVAWLLMQIATQVFPFLEIPNWAIRLVIMLIVIGFPIALVIAWAFELTPEGIKRAEDVDPSQSITRNTFRSRICCAAARCPSRPVTRIPTAAFPTVCPKSPSRST